MKVSVQVEIPDGFELDTDSAEVDSKACVNFSVPIRPAWTWPAWLKAEWIAMDESGFWWAYATTPAVFGKAWGSADGAILLLDPELLDFTPPLCTDWKQSLRRNPNLKEVANA